MDKFETLKEYKKLLDADIITQEEFDLKKAELLGSGNKTSDSEKAAQAEAAKKAAEEQARLEAEEASRKDKTYDSAINQMSAGTVKGYEAAIKEFESIVGWKDADEQIVACQKMLEEQKKIEEAKRQEAARQAEIRRAENKKKTKKIAIILVPIVCVIAAIAIVANSIIIPNNKYSKATELYNNGSYEEAISAFEELNGYKDSAEQIEKCKTAIKEENYNNAIELINSGNYKEAYEGLIALEGYKDSAEKASEILGKYEIESVKNASVGGTVVFGSYEQDNDTSNGKEPIEWNVLEKDGNKVLVISKYALDDKDYHDSWKSTNWEKCWLRKWLNKDFANEAFNSDELNMIVDSTVTADENPRYSKVDQGNDVTDKLFLLSTDEAEKYFEDDASRLCSPTAYAIAQYQTRDNYYEDVNLEHVHWWLRTIGWDPSNVTVVTEKGEIGYYGTLDHPENYVLTDSYGVRPAMWISVK